MKFALSLIAAAFGAASAAKDITPGAIKADSMSVNIAFRALRCGFMLRFVFSLFASILMFSRSLYHSFTYYTNT